MILLSVEKLELEIKVKVIVLPLVMVLCRELTMLGKILMVEMLAV